MLLGRAEERKLAAVGVSFSERLFSSRYVGISYLAEIRPLMTIGDPTTTGLRVDYTEPSGHAPYIINYGRQVPLLKPAYGRRRITYTDPVTGTYYDIISTNFRGRRWTYVGALSPVGFQLNLAPRKRLQPIVSGLGGFAVSPRDIPLFRSSAFNFTFGGGIGLQWNQDSNHCWWVEYRYHHLSSDYIGQLNPGIDSGILHVSYTFGRSAPHTPPVH